MKAAGDRVPARELARLQRFARERAHAEAARIPWQRLLEAREDYIDWQEFYLWVRTFSEWNTVFRGGWPRS